MLTGTGANGKSTLLETLANVFGPLALNMPFSTFTVKWGGHSASNDMAQLPGKRLVCASETGEASAIDEARIKAVTGQDTISARYLYHEFFSFQPVCKMWLSCNHRPIVNDDTYAFWRRVRCIEFPRRFSGSEIDPNLKAALTAESEGILAWAVQRAVEYLAEGLPVPEAVKLTTDAYQAETDPLADFFADKCCFGEAKSAKSAELYQAYNKWADDRGLQKGERLTWTAFGRKLGSAYKKGQGRQRTTYLGIGLRGVETRDWKTT